MPFKHFVSPYELSKIKNTKCCHDCSFKLILICTSKYDRKKHTFNQWEFDKKVDFVVTSVGRSSPSCAPVTRQGTKDKHYPDKHLNPKLFIKNKACRPRTHTILTNSHLLEDISQFLHVVVVVLLTILPGCKALVLLLHIRFPNM